MHDVTYIHTVVGHRDMIDFVYIIIEKDVLVGAMKLQHTFTNTQLQDIFRRHMRYHCYTYDCLETRYVDAVKKKGKS